MFTINIVLFIGVTLTVGLLLGKLTKWLKITSIVGYIIAGIVLGYITHTYYRDILSNSVISYTVDITLGFVGFIVGVGFTKNFIKKFGKISIAIAVIESVVTLIIITLGCYIITSDINLSLILGVIGLATAPAGTVAAIQMSKGRGDLSRITMAIVGIDDAIAIILFVFIMAVVKINLGENFQLINIVSVPLVEIGGAILIGGVFGVLIAYITKYIQSKEDIFVLALSFIFFCIGLSNLISASSILACMVFGTIYININPRMGKVVIKYTEHLLPPIFVLFFGIAGIELAMKFDYIITYGVLSIFGLIVVYTIFRILGKLSGATIAGKYTKSPSNVKKYLGFALLSQAGVNIGLAILANNEVSSSAASIGMLVIIIMTITTIFFEIIGPIGVRFALTRSGEAYD
jgi:Kef-type K+ transport system membrane component KefB